MIRVEHALRAALERHRTSVVPAPDRSRLALRLARHDRMRVARRASVAGAAIAAAIAVGFVTTRDSGGNTIDVSRADRPAAEVTTAPSALGTTATTSPSTTGTIAIVSPTTIAAAPPATAAPVVVPPVTTTPEPDPPEPDPPEESPPETSPPPDGSFTATYGSGESSESPPWDEYFGTAPPDSAVAISSPYGSGSTTTDPDGYWSTTVEFPAAPVGETFSVTLTNEAGTATVPFTRTA